MGTITVQTLTRCSHSSLAFQDHVQLITSEWLKTLSAHLGRLVPLAEAIAIARDLDKMIDDAGSKKPEAKAGIAAQSALCAPMQEACTKLLQKGLVHSSLPGWQLLRFVILLAIRQFFPDLDDYEPQRLCPVGDGEPSACFACPRAPEHTHSASRCPGANGCSSCAEAASFQSTRRALEEASFQSSARCMKVT